MPISKAVSFGNESDLGPPEFLHYMARDSETKVICLYVEGTRRSDELKKAIFDAAARKPLIILKGGLTETGGRAVASHTGAMSGSAAIWEALARQAGAILVNDFDELVDMAFLFSLSKPPSGNRIGLLTISGGFGVYATDQVINSGFELPEFSDSVKKGVAKFIDAPGTSVNNPVDMAAKSFQPENFSEMYSTLNSDNDIDSFVIICSIEYMTFFGDNQDAILDYIFPKMIEAMKEFKKPVYIAFLHTAIEYSRLKNERAFLKAGYPVFATVQRCLTAMKRAQQYRGSS